MTCSRCCSLMFESLPLRFSSAYSNQTELEDLRAFQCPCCGNYVDSVVVQNRRAQLMARQGVPA